MTETAEQLYDAGLKAFRSGDVGGSLDCNQRSLGLARQQDDLRGQARALIGLSRLAFRDQDYDELHRLAQESETLALQAADEETAIMALHMRAEAARAQRFYDNAVPLYEESIARRRAIDDGTGVTMELYNLGAVLAQRGDSSAALGLLREALERAGDEDGQWLVAYCVAACGAATVAQDPEMAARLIGAADAEFARLGEVLDPAEGLERSFALDGIRGRIGDEATESALGSGALLNVEQALSIMD